MTLPALTRQADRQLAIASDCHEVNGVWLWAGTRPPRWAAEALARHGERGESAREHPARALEPSREHGYGLFEPRAAALVETESATGT